MGFGFHVRYADQDCIAGLITYVVDSLVETSVSRDILQLTRVDKPDLLRRLFDLGCAYSGQVLAYQKMVGQLRDAGNTTTLAHYLTLLEHAGLLRGLGKYAGEKVRQRASSPKLLEMNNALVTTAIGTDPAGGQGLPLEDFFTTDPAEWL